VGAIFSRTNLADTATLTENTSGSMLRPLTELQKAWARGLARGPENGTGSVPAELTLRADLGSSKAINIVGLFGLNDAVTTGEIRLSATAFGNTDAGTATIGNSGSFGQTHGNAAVWRGSSTCRYIEIYLQVFSLPAGLRHVDARRLWIGEATTEATNFLPLSAGVNFDWSVETNDLSGTSTTPRGGIFVSSQGSYRTWRLGVTGMTLTEATQLRQWLALTRGKQEIVAVLRDYGNAYEDLSDNTIYGRLAEWAPVQHTGGDTYACESIVIQEVPYPAL
jgi:hypothetical protein